MKVAASLFIAAVLAISFSGVALAEQGKIKCPACGYQLLTPSDK